MPLDGKRTLVRVVLVGPLRQAVALGESLELDASPRQQRVQLYGKTDRRSLDRLQGAGSKVESESVEGAKRTLQLLVTDGHGATNSHVHSGSLRGGR